jgi:hypothetical protein
VSHMGGAKRLRETSLAVMSPVRRLREVWMGQQCRGSHASGWVYGSWVALGCAPGPAERTESNPSH